MSRSFRTAALVLRTAKLTKPCDDSRQEFQELRKKWKFVKREKRERHEAATSQLTNLPDPEWLEGLASPSEIVPPTDETVGFHS
ncbi:unnamed protein product [Nippostrongylus brasiliensis]|uniref:MADF domain-containing protein n=1 Tax=Nippostrongylus brasiliensis TaxID=27835 RepID=A0A0N4YCA6_NIPBR|nr:unnamed protein product [Nippostrongylus brasiliensis]